MDGNLVIYVDVLNLKVRRSINTRDMLRLEVYFVFCRVLKQYYSDEQMF